MSDSQLVQRYFLTRSNPNIYIDVSNSSSFLNGIFKLLHFHAPINSIISRLVLKPFLSTVLSYTMTDPHTKLVIMMDNILHMNVLISLSSLGLFMKEISSRFGYKFLLSTTFPRPIPQRSLDNVSSRPDADIMQFRTIFDSSTHEFTRSFYNPFFRRFEWVKASSAVYTKYQRYKQKQILELDRLSKYVHQLTNFVDTELYIEYMHLGLIQVSFIGSGLDIIEKLSTLHGAAKQRLLDAKIDIFPFKQKTVICNILNQIRDKSGPKLNEQDLRELDRDVLYKLPNDYNKHLLNELKRELSDVTLRDYVERSVPVSVSMNMKPTEYVKQALLLFLTAKVSPKK